MDYINESFTNINGITSTRGSICPYPENNVGNPLCLCNNLVRANHFTFTFANGMWVAEQLPILDLWANWDRESKYLPKIIEFGNWKKNSDYLLYLSHFPYEKTEAQRKLVNFPWYVYKDNYITSYISPDSSFFIFIQTLLFL